MKKAALKKRENAAIKIINRDDQLWTTSLDIADKFGKIHRDVVSKIENLECSEEFLMRNFAHKTRHWKHGKQKYFIISRDYGDE